MTPLDPRRFRPCENSVLPRRRRKKYLVRRRQRLAREAGCLHASPTEHARTHPYTVNIVMDVWECDLVGVRALGIFNDNYKYIISVIDIFSKFLHQVPLRSKTGTAVASVFTSIFKDSLRRRSPVWVRTDKGKEFLNRHYREMLKREGIQFQVFRNSDVKYSVVEHAHWTNRDRLYKYFTYKIPIGISTLSQNLSRPTMTRFTRRRAWRRRVC